MQCQTVLPGTECTFWSKNGCVFVDSSCQNIVEECKGCDRIVEGAIGEVCSVAPSPSFKWGHGLCNMATHKKVEISSVEKKINPLKASKAATKKKK